MGDCVFCDTPLKGFSTVKLRENGSDSINKASIERQSDICVIPGQEVHVNCRRDFILKRNSIGSPDFNNNDSTCTTKCSTRSSGLFDFKHKFIFCTHDGIGKTSALKMLCRSPQLQEVAINFMKSESKQEVVRNAPGRQYGSKY